MLRLWTAAIPAAVLSGLVVFALHSAVRSCIIGLSAAGSFGTNQPNQCLWVQAGDALSIVIAGVSIAVAAWGIIRTFRAHYGGTHPPTRSDPK
jgi:hypothetical protein